MKKILGRTSIELNPIGLGTGDYFWNADISKKRKIEIIKFAVENGINFIDTAAEYGNGISEELVREGLKGFNGKVYISTKFSPENNGFESILKSCENSLKRLGVESIDIFQLHWPNPSISIQETTKALNELYKKGKIKTVGLCNCSLFEIEEFGKGLDNLLLASIQREYNIRERLVEVNGILEFCENKSVSFFAYSPLDQGQNKLSKEQKKMISRLSNLYKLTKEQIFLSYLISSKQTSVIIRTTSKKHLVENINVQNIKIAPSDIKKIKEVFPISVINIDINCIMVSENGNWNHNVYQSVEEAINNKYNFCPSPKDLSKTIKKMFEHFDKSVDLGYLIENDLFKPVKLKKINDTTAKYKYELIEGRIRYWAWVISNVNNKIPSYVVN
tara:strand:- start:2482 stop:3645 length:1164 start_codon:yes stop_codon:yes gene_type:complete